MVQRTVPSSRLLSASVNGVAEHRSGQLVRALVGQINLDDHIATAAQHTLRCTRNSDAHVHRKGRHTPFSGVSVQDFQPQPQRIQVFDNAVIETDAHASVVIELAIVHAALAGRSTSVQLTDDAVVLVKQRRTRRAAFGHTALPLVNPPHCRPCGIIVVCCIFVNANFLQVPRRVVNARGGLDCGRIRTIPTRIKNIVTRWRSFIEFQQGKV